MSVVEWEASASVSPNPVAEIDDAVCVVASNSILPQAMRSRVQQRQTLWTAEEYRYPVNGRRDRGRREQKAEAS